MKKKKMACLLAVIGLGLFCACTSGNAGASEKSDPTSIVSEAGPQETSVTQESSGQQDPDKPVQEQTKKEIDVFNNGGSFVGVNGRIYYREYGSYSLSGVALYGDFLGGENYGGARIQCIEKSGSEPVTIAEQDDGYGALIYHDGYLYSQRKENWEENVIYRIKLEDGSSEKLCDGYLLGGSEDGRWIAVEEYLDGKGLLKILDAGVPGEKVYSSVTGYFNYLGSYEDKVFFTLHSTEDEDIYLMQYDYSGTLANLAKLPKDETGYGATPSAQNVDVHDGTISFVWEFYAGTGHYLDSAYQVRVPLCLDAAQANPSVPMYETTANALSIWDDSQVGNYSAIYEAAVDEDAEIAALEEDLTRWLNGASGVAVIPQTIERVGDEIYGIIATAHRYAMDDIGWREAYQLMELKYFHYAKGSKEMEVLSRVATDEGPITAYLWVVGKSGSETEKAVYQMAMFMGPEVMPEVDAYLFGAKLSENLVYEHPADDDIYGEWTKGGIEDFYAELRRFRKSYLSKEPTLSDYQGYEIPSGLGTSDVMAVHVGFDEEGKICYLRPVVMD
ncbi:MAG: hypothetical protein J6Z22_07015 [Lachnospiraceae bacterium]|nr:hypothetical protein [Lachnospiraceae bacterium]